MCENVHEAANILKHEDNDTPMILANLLSINIAANFEIPLGSPVYQPLQWTSGDFDKFTNFTKSNTGCLKNVPLRLFKSPTCGNGFLEANEECDCGLPSVCRSSCCDPLTCKKRPNSLCTTGKEHYE